MKNKEYVHRRVSLKKKMGKLSFVELSSNASYYFLCDINLVTDLTQFEASRVIMTRELRRSRLLSRKKRSLWVYPIASWPFSKKSSQSRMGKGKGLISEYKASVARFSPVFKLRNITDRVAIRLRNMISSKLCFPIGILKLEEGILNHLG